MNRLLIILPLTALILFATMKSYADTSELADFKAAIRAKYDLKEQAFADGVAAPIVENFYSADVFSVDNEGNTHRGREELRPLYEEVSKSSNVRVESVNTKVSGDMGWDWANFYVTPKDPAEQPFSFKILFLWQRIDGQWWCAGDMYVVGQFKTDQ
jgi:ketosteroid isomerase-like protein